MDNDNEAGMATDTYEANVVKAPAEGGVAQEAPIYAQGVGSAAGVANPEELPEPPQEVEPGRPYTPEPMPFPHPLIADFSPAQHLNAAKSYVDKLKGHLNSTSVSEVQRNGGNIREVANRLYQHLIELF